MDRRHRRCDREKEVTSQYGSLFASFPGLIDLFASLTHRASLRISRRRQSVRGRISAVVERPVVRDMRRPVGARSIMDSRRIASSSDFAASTLGAWIGILVVVAAQRVREPMFVAS